MRLPRCTVGFVYNEPCPLKCNFCCHTPENVGPGKLTPENVTPVLIGYAKHPKVFRFAFTGGDPFVYIKDILLIMKRARAAGVSQPFHIVTSGYWAKTDEVVDSLMSELKWLGMDMLYVSYDDEHQKWVPPEYVYRIERACEKYSVILSVYGVFWDNRKRVRELLPELKTSFVNETIASPIGRARVNWHLMATPNLADDVKYSCGRPLDYDITIYPNGDTFPCCSGGFNKEAKLKLGNSFQDEPEEIVGNCFSNFKAIVAKEIGFHKLLSKIADSSVNVKGIPKFSQISSVCEMCTAIHGSDGIMESIDSVLTEMEVEHCVTRFTSLLSEGESPINVTDGERYGTSNTQQFRDNQPS